LFILADIPVALSKLVTRRDLTKNIVRSFVLVKQDTEEARQQTHGITEEFYYSQSHERRGSIGSVEAGADLGKG
jgi:hypothetical protein